MGLEFEKYDVITEKELEIKEFFSDTSKAGPILSLANYIKEKKDIIMVKTLMSILFKARIKSIYMLDKINEQKNEEDKINEIETIIREIYVSKDIDNIEHIILKYGNKLKKILEEFFYKQQFNYIKEKILIENIIDQKMQKEILELNPFMLCQLFDICSNPLTEEENIINEIIDYSIESKKSDSIPNILSKIYQNNYISDSLSKKMFFIISDVIKESSEKESELCEKLMNIYENCERNSNKMLIYIMSDESLKYEIIGKFIEYNMHIKEGRLQELDNNCSEYVKTIANNIYRKNP